MLAIFILIELTFLWTYRYIKLHLLLDSDGLAIWYDFPVINMLKSKVATDRSS